MWCEATNFEPSEQGHTTYSVCAYGLVYCYYDLDDKKAKISVGHLTQWNTVGLRWWTQERASAPFQVLQVLSAYRLTYRGSKCLIYESCYSGVGWMAYCYYLWPSGDMCMFDLQSKDVASTNDLSMTYNVTLQIATARQTTATSRDMETVTTSQS